MNQTMNNINDLTPRGAQEAKPVPLNAIIENTDALFCYLDKELNFVAFNSSCIKVFKSWYKTEIKTGDNILTALRALGESEVAEWSAILGEVLSGNARKFIRKYPHHGITRYINFNVQPVLENGAMAGISCFATDVTENKMLSDKLKAAELRYRMVSNSPMLGICWASEQGKILYTNQSFSAMLGYSNLEMMDMHFAKFTSAEDMGDQLELMDKLRRGEKNSYRFEKRYLTKTGKTMWGEIILSAGRDSKGVLKYYIGLVQDITYRKQAEEDLKTLNESLEAKIKERTAALTEANRELEAFNYSVSHDLQTPLRTINGFSRILLSDYAKNMDAEGRQLLEQINSGSGNAGQLIRHLLEFSRLNTTNLIKKEINMQRIVDDVLAGIQSGEKPRQAEIKVEALGVACCDPLLIKQVWTNLIWNALKYSSKKEKPVIEIGGKQVNNENIYYIKDNGAGFDMAEQDKLFRAFQRLHSETEFEGTGIGLATVQRIVGKHGGRVWAEGEVNKGATFWFSLPVIENCGAD